MTGTSQEVEHQVLMGDVNGTMFCLRISELTSEENQILEDFKSFMGDNFSINFTNADFDFSLNIILPEIVATESYTMDYSGLTAEEKQIILDAKVMIEAKM